MVTFFHRDVPFEVPYESCASLSSRLEFRDFPRHIEFSVDAAVTDPAFSLFLTYFEHGQVKLTAETFPDLLFLSTEFQCLFLQSACFTFADSALRPASALDCIRDHFTRFGPTDDIFTFLANRFVEFAAIPAFGELPLNTLLALRNRAPRLPPELRPKRRFRARLAAQL
jgi:hypothetical protein